jgi:1-acyl-sn-glycerol-3-phosphate acyltransferase
MTLLSIVRFIGRPLFRVMFSVEYHGLENIPETGSLIIAGNHPSYLDPLLVGLPIKRVIKFMAWDALFRVPLLGRLIRGLGAFPVDIRRGKGESAFKEACRVLESGYALGIFPEGQRSEGGPMGELRTGVARLAIDTGAPILPVTIGGASRAWPKYKLLPKPAKIIIRYHPPIRLTAFERVEHKDDREFHAQVMARVAESINRSLTPALRGSQAWEKWYRRPPSHIRIYEWVPLAAAIIATLILLGRGRLEEHWLRIWLPPAVYYAYLIADLTLIQPARFAKWMRNSMPVSLILIWHYPLSRALEVPTGELNALLALVSLATFFAFFWEDYYTLQKFVRGLVVVYYISLALLLEWPHEIAVLVAALSFIAAFSLWYRTVYYFASATVTLVSIGAALLLVGPAWVLLIYLAVGIAAIAYIQTFAAAAYDIRRADNYAERVGME